jgi:alpha-beta hydrolase superfamily lysophospholipase
MPERISFTTEDEVNIAGTWSPAPTINCGALLLHMMPETRESWAYVQRAWAAKGVATLAIDFRGHGESVSGPNGERLDFRQFKDEEHRSYIWDVIGALRWMRERGIAYDRIYIVGASIGANIAIQALTEEPHLAGAVVLSPSRDYRGIKALVDVQNTLPHQSLYIISSEDDTPSYADSQKLFQEAPVTEKVFQPYKKAGHGTSMLKSDPTLVEKIPEWMLKNIR